MHRSSDLAARLVLRLRPAGASRAGEPENRAGPATRPHPRWLGLLALLLLGACGGGARPGLSLELDRQALSGDPVTFALSFHAPGLTCDEVRQAQPRPTPLAGPFTLAVADGSRASTFRVDEVPQGVYLVWVDALDAQGGVVGSGCATEQRIFDRELSRIRIRIS